MIVLTKLNRAVFYLNPYWIEKVEENPDTVITLTDGKTYRCRETAFEVTEAIKHYYQSILNQKGVTS